MANALPRVCLAGRSFDASAAASLRATSLCRAGMIVSAGRTFSHVAIEPLVQGE
jgi:hypothetical protein